MTRLNNGVTLWSAATSQQVGDIEPYCPDVSGLNMMISVNLSLMAASSQMSWKHVIKKIPSPSYFNMKRIGKGGDQNNTFKNLCFLLVYFTLQRDLLE